MILEEDRIRERLQEVRRWYARQLPGRVSDLETRCFVLMGGGHARGGWGEAARIARSMAGDAGIHEFPGACAAAEDVGRFAAERRDDPEPVDDEAIARARELFRRLLREAEAAARGAAE